MYVRLALKAALSRQEFYAVTENSMLMVSCRDALSTDSPKIEGIEGNRLLRAGKIRRNPTTIALTVFFPTSSRVQSCFGGLSCRRSGRFERRPSMIDDCAFFKYFFQIFSPHGADYSFQKYRTHTQTNTQTHTRTHTRTHTHRKVNWP